MKKTISIIAILFLSISSGFGQQPVPANIETTISQAFERSFQSEANVMADFTAEMETQYGTERDEARYWLAYAYYQYTISEMQIGKKKIAEKAVDRAIELLEEDENPDSEDLALLSSAIGLSINFNAWKAPFLGSKSESLAEKAIELDPNNARAYLAIGRSSYYKPAMFGGGDQVEGMMKKAISLPDQSQKSATSPSWGKPEAYYLLANYYRQEERMEDAYTYCMRGLKQFPEDHRLNNLKTKIDKKAAAAGR